MTPENNSDQNKNLTENESSFSSPQLPPNNYGVAFDVETKSSNNRKTNKKRYLLLLGLFLLIGLVLLFVVVLNEDKEDNKQLSVESLTSEFKNEVLDTPCFSFEYPKNFRAIEYKTEKQRKEAEESAEGRHECETVSEHVDETLDARLYTSPSETYDVIAGIRPINYEDFKRAVQESAINNDIWESEVSEVDANGNRAFRVVNRWNSPVSSYSKRAHTYLYVWNKSVEESGSDNERYARIAVEVNISATFKEDTDAIGHIVKTFKWK